MCGMRGTGFALPARGCPPPYLNGSGGPFSCQSGGSLADGPSDELVTAKTMPTLMHFWAAFGVPSYAELQAIAPSRHDQRTMALWLRRRSPA